MYADLPLIAATSLQRRRRISSSTSRMIVKGLIRLADIAVIGLSGAVLIFWRFFDAPVPASTTTALLLGVVLAAHVLPMFGVYRHERLTATTYQLSQVLVAWGLTLAILVTILYAARASQDISRIWIGAWLVVGSAGLIAVRAICHLVLSKRAVAESVVQRLAVVGCGEQLPVTVRRLRMAEPISHVAAILELGRGAPKAWPRSILPLEDFVELEDRVRRGDIDHVVLSMSELDGRSIERVLDQLRHLPVDVSWAPELPSPQVPVLGGAQVGNVYLMQLMKRPLDGWHLMLKDVADRILAIILMCLAGPLILLIALAVRLDSPGPVFYRQKRHGFSCEPIDVLKFRTMYEDVCDAPDARTLKQVTKGDLRVTRVGRFLRHTSLDELPQLINVVRGEMSLVGPRPHALAHDRYYAGLIDDYLSRYKVKPGITGWAQVHGFRGETRTVEQMRRRIELDIQYIDNWSLAFDLHILLRTLWTGFRHANAY